MTAHYYGNWKLADPVTDELKEQVLECVRINIRMSEAGCFNCFAIMSDGDQVVLWLTRMWTLSLPEMLYEKLKSDADQSPTPKSLLEIGTYVFDELRKGEDQ